jgi:hypothetical protein
VNHIDLTKIKLISGTGHGDDLCVMQWVARFAHEDESSRPTDHPECTSPVLAAFAIAFNDGVDDETRQRLIPFISRLVGTAGDPAADAARAWLATDWLVRTFTPRWLRKAGLTAEADALEALPELTTTELAHSAQPIIDGARDKAYAAWAAAGDAAGDAAWAAAGDAAWAAAGAAAWAAAGAAARATKGSYSAKYAAACKAADDVLKPLYAETIVELRESALALFDRMIDDFGNQYLHRLADPEAGEGALDEAWREAEASIPGGWMGPSLHPNGVTQWAAETFCRELPDDGGYDHEDHHVEATGDSPAAALRALAARLRSGSDEGTT